MDLGPMLQNGLGWILLMKFEKITQVEVFFAKLKEANTILFLEPNGSVIHAGDKGDKGREPMINKQTLLHFFCDMQVAISCCLNPTVNDSKPSTAMANPDVDGWTSPLKSASQLVVGHPPLEGVESWCLVDFQAPRSGLKIINNQS